MVESILGWYLRGGGGSNQKPGFRKGGGPDSFRLRGVTREELEDLIRERRGSAVAPTSRGAVKPLIEDFHLGKNIFVFPLLVSKRESITNGNMCFFFLGT